MFVEQTSNISNKKLDPNKAHEYDKISICMLKLCGDSINIPFKNCLNKRIFPNVSKKANVASIN